MGLTLQKIEKMQELGLHPVGKGRVLDVGSSNLYQASKEGVLNFLRKNGVRITAETESFAERLAAGSAYSTVTGGTNESFAGELYEKAGIGYDAIDIADGYRTTILDLNHQSAPPKFVGAFDLVMNFGTTEHLLNQYNAFKVLHDCAKVGGHILHSIPCAGYSNHGYFTYTPRCMFDLAGYNEYEVVDFQFDGPGGMNDLYAPLRDYSAYFPNLMKTYEARSTTVVGKAIEQLQLPDIALFIVYKKVKNKPFAGALEMTTSVGHVPDSVSSKYQTVETA